MDFVLALATGTGMRTHYFLLFLMIVFADRLHGAGKHGEEGRRRRGQRRTRYSLQAFEPWFPHPMAPNRGGRWRAPSARQGEVRSRPDLHPTMDRLLATSQIADPFKPNVNLSSLGVDTQMLWMSGLSSVKRSKDVLYYDKYSKGWKAIEFNVRVENIRVYMVYQVSSYYFFLKGGNGSAYIDSAELQALLAFNLQTNNTIIHTLAMTQRSRLRVDFDQAGRDILVAAIEVFYADDVNGKILPEIKTALQHEIGFIHIKAVLDRISPGQN